MKKQIKKSLSLFLAVLMLMTSWVWVAPEKAEAGAPNNYTVTVDYEIMACCSGNEAPDESRLEVTHISKNGTADTSSTSSKDGGDLGDKEGVKGSLSIDVAGWPSEVYFRVENTSIGKYHVKVLAVKINGTEVLKGKWVMERTASRGADGVRVSPNAQGTGGTVASPGDSEEEVVWNWPKPSVESLDVALSDDTIVLNRVNSGIVSTPTITLSNFVDNYGVNWTGATNPIFSLRSVEGITLGNDTAYLSGSGNSRTINIRPWLQTLFNGGSDAKLYIDWNVLNGTKTGTETISVEFPDNTVTFKGNGGKIGDDEDSVKDDIIYENEGMYVGAIIHLYPTHATKPGFEFMGFYSKQNADALGKDTDFKGTKFEEGVTVVPHSKGAENGYDTDEAGTFYGDTTWYAAWQAAPVNATFVTADNQLIATLTGRHNNYMTAENMYNGLTNLNIAVKAAYTGTSIKFNESDYTPVYKDGSTSYEFAGWKIIKADDESIVDKVVTANSDIVITGDVTYQATYRKASAEKYSVYFEDGNGNKYAITDNNGTVIGDKYYSYRDDVVIPSEIPVKAQDDTYDYEFIGWAKDIGKDYYTVDNKNQDETGAVIVYTHKDGAEFSVAGDAGYVPVFRMIYREYNVTFNYKVDGNIDASTTVGGYHWNDVVKMPEINSDFAVNGNSYGINGWMIGGSSTVKPLSEIKVNGNITLTAVYKSLGVAKYTINFYGKAEDGETDVLLNEGNNIYVHKTAVAAPEVPGNINTADSLYTFAGWTPDVNTTATAHANYYATYTRKDYADVHFYNYDGSLIYELDGKESGYFVGESKIPAYENLVDGVNVLPVKEEDAIGKYTFTGWKNGAGEFVKPGEDIFSGDTYLYAQFDTEYKEYTVVFVDEDEVISQEKYHYGDTIVVPSNPVKAADKAYIYDFKGWSPDVSKVCYGNAVYSATYRKTAQYYKVTWFMDDQKTVLSESNYRYGSKINQAIAADPITYGKTEEGYTWVLKEWIQCDADGKPVNADGEHVSEAEAARFARGQVMEGKALYFYPVYKASPNNITVSFYKENGTTHIGDVKIPFGSNISDYDDDIIAKAIDTDAEYHYVIEKWLDVNTNKEVKVVNNDVTAVKAVCVAEKHKWEIYNVEAYPTCNISGCADYICSVFECSVIKEDDIIAPLEDEGKPTGLLYVGSNKWNSAEFEAGIDYSDIKFVGPDAQLVVNAKDTGSVSSPYNEDGSRARGVGKIEYYLATGQLNPTTITGWTEIYNVEVLKQEVLTAVLEEYKINLVEYNSYIKGTAEQKMKKAEIDRAVDTLLSSYNANATSIVSNLNLVDGKTYVIYIRITDREGNGEVNTSYLSSGTISYGTKAPVIEVTGEGYSSKFCEEANIRITDDNNDLQIYLDGEAVSAYTNPGTTSANGTFVASFKTTEKGSHTVTVIDKNGNKTTKIFEIKGNHTFKNYTILASCDNNGSRYDICTVCGTKEVVEVLYAKGHDFSSNYVDKAATCVADGYRTYVCNNNCGLKLILKPTDDAVTLAQAKVARDPSADEIEWRDLTAEDLKHLVATKVHTYEKVKDENGEDTVEDIWVVDKAATCKAEGSMHKDCTKCGERVIETIPVDTVDGHKFYREKVTKEPTCTEKGEKTKTCRYCNDVVIVEYIDALDHTDGEYLVVKPATCTEKGSKILTCATCGEDLGEEIETDAIKHAWKISGAVYEDGGKYYQNYVCKNDDSHTKLEEVEDYEPPVAAVVTFDFGKNGGYYVVPAVGAPNEFGYVSEMMKGTQKVNAYVGETISADEVATALKADTATKTYKFSYWADAEGKEVKFPIEVKGDATFYAVYSEKYVNYTITYYKDETTEYKKTGYLHNGDEVTLAAGPSKAETNLVTYKFVGWKVYGSNPEVVYTDKVTIDGANIALVAKYTEVKKMFAVTYAYSKSNILETFSVEAGSTARDCAIIPEKASDANNHYEFDGWNRAAQLAKVESNIYTTPNFRAISHTYVTTEKIAAACGVNQVVTKTCECGHTYDAEVKNSALEHIWGNPVFDAETGKNVVTCTREGCGVSEADTRTFSAKFYVSETDTDPKNVPYIPWGTTIDATRLPAEPTKESTSTADYAFKGWAVKGDETKAIVDFTTYVVKANVEFIAVFTATKKVYSVTFVYDARNPIEIFAEVEAGSSVTFDGAKPVKNFDNNYHYTFTNWQGYAAGPEGEEQKITITDVQSDLTIYADFAKADHVYAEGAPIGTATCTQGIGTRYTCTGCAKYYDVAGKPLDHDFSIEIDRKEATLTEEGYVVYKCATCPEGSEATYTEKLKKLESTTTYINVKVVDSEGKALSGANVDIYVEGKYDKSYTTDSNGEVSIVVAKDASYSFIVEYDGKDITGGLKVAELGEDKVNTVVVNISKCSCACHGDGIWSGIFRFFHKMIKMFTGEFKCCNDPDARYN